MFAVASERAKYQLSLGTYSGEGVKLNKLKPVLKTVMYFIAETFSQNVFFEKGTQRLKLKYIYRIKRKGKIYIEKT